MGKRIGLVCILFLFSSIAVWGAQLSYEQAIKKTPNPRKQNTWISDPQKVISSKKKQFIRSKLNALNTKTGIEFAVVVHNDLPVTSQKEFAHRLFNKWGVGQKGKNNGLLFTFAVKQKQYAFESGYGIESTLPDGKQKLLFKSTMAPHFKAGKYGEGILAGVSKISNLLIQADLADKAALSSPAPQTDPNAVNAFDQDSGTPIYKEVGPVLWWPLLFSLIALAAMSYGILDYRRRISWPVPRQGGREAAERIYLRLLLPVLVTCAATFFWSVYFRTDELLWAIVGVLFLYVLFYFRHKKVVRNMPRQCPEPGCQALMGRLKESEEDEHLDSRQEKEEELDSIQYDVWFCEDHERIIVEDYEQFMSGYSKCKHCKAKTLEDLGSVVLTAPTYTSTGRGRTDYKCRHCGKSYSTHYTIARKQRSSSSSSSSGSSWSGSSGSSSSSSGSSFGGGSSGGGGASGNW